MRSFLYFTKIFLSPKLKSWFFLKIWESKVTQSEALSAPPQSKPSTPVILSNQTAVVHSTSQQQMNIRRQIPTKAMNISQTIASSGSMTGNIWMLESRWWYKEHCVGIVHVICLFSFSQNTTERAFYDTTTTVHFSSTSCAVHPDIGTWKWSAHHSTTGKSCCKIFLATCFLYFEFLYCKVSYFVMVFQMHMPPHLRPGKIYK